MEGHTSTFSNLTYLDPNMLSWMRGEDVALASEQESVYDPCPSLLSVSVMRRFCTRASSIR